MTSKFVQNPEFEKIWSWEKVNTSQQMLVKIVLTKSMMSQLSENVSGVPQSILDRFSTFCEETQHF